MFNNDFQLKILIKLGHRKTFNNLKGFIWQPAFNGFCNFRSGEIDNQIDLDAANTVGTNSAHGF